MTQQPITMIASALGILVLILDSTAALTGCRAGLELCIQTLIPSLFPYFVLTALLTGSLAGRHSRVFAPLEKLCRIPTGTGALVVIGLLGGYPTGARNVALAYQSGTLDKKTALRMMPFCNNAGPAFLFGMIAPLFGNTLYPWLLWGIHILSTLITAVLLPGRDTSVTLPLQTSRATLSEAMEAALKAMASVCGWVVFFRMAITFLDRWILWALPLPGQVFCKGLLELSNGCILLGKISSTGLRMILCSVMLALGGLCVTMQTRSVTSALSMTAYFPGKLIQGSISLFLSLLAQYLLPDTERYTVSPVLTIFIFMISLFPIFLGKRKNKGRFPIAVGV